MSDEININLKRAVLHILDVNLDVPVLSEIELCIDGEINEFVEKHVIRILKDNDIKNAAFLEGQNKFKQYCEYLCNDNESFLEVTQHIAEDFFTVMKSNADISSADLLCCLFEEYGTLYLGILKMNYKNSYIHFAKQSENGNINTIIKQKTSLPSESVKIEECVIVSLNDLNIQLIEKKYEINGQKDFYISSILLNCSSDLSNNSKIKILNKTVQKINKKYFDDDVSKAVGLKKAVSDSFSENSAIAVQDVANTVFSNNTDIKEVYMSEIKKAGIKEDYLKVPEQLITKKFTNHKICTDTGVEINFPSDFYSDNEKMEFINNPDGTISILIKNVTRIINK